MSSLFCVCWTVGFDEHKIVLPSYGRFQFIYFRNVKYGIKRDLDRCMYMCYMCLEVAAEVKTILWYSVW